MFEFNLTECYLNDISEVLDIEFGIDKAFVAKLFLDVGSDTTAINIDFDQTIVESVEVNKPITSIKLNSILTTQNYYKSVIMMVASEFSKVPGVSNILCAFPVWGAPTVGIHTEYTICNVNEYTIPMHSSFLAVIFKKMNTDKMKIQAPIKCNMLDGVYYIDQNSAFKKNITI